MQTTLASSRLAAPQRAPQRASLRTRAKTPRPMRATHLICRAADSKEVLEGVRNVIAEQLGKDLEAVTPESKFVDLGADSLDTVEIMMALEERFDTKMDEEAAQSIATVKDAADLIASQLK